MKRRVRVLSRAARDLTEIQAYLARASPEEAERLVDELLQTIERLGAFPESGPVARDPHLRGLGFRYVVCGRYLVFYKLVGTHIRVYRLLHERRAYERLL